MVNLSLIPVIVRHFGGNFAGRSAYELSSYGATYDFLRTHFRDFTFSEYMPERDFGKIYDGIRNEDVQKLTFGRGVFDLVTSNQVFEHVPDDEAAYRECFRVLKEGGALIFTVPLHETSQTEQVAELTGNGQIRWLGTPEYHDSRLGGPRSAPVFWRYSARDLPDRVRKAGFRRVTLEEVVLCPAQGVPERVVYAVK